MKKLLVLLLGVAVITGSAYAAASLRGAKAMKTVNYSATAVRACLGPGVAYSVILSTGAVTDYAVLRDTNTANTSSSPSAIVAHIAAASNQVTFDPPLQFQNGISFNVPATTYQATLVYECGRVVTGY